MDKNREFLDVFWYFFAFWTITSKNFTGIFFEEQSDGDTAGAEDPFLARIYRHLRPAKDKARASPLL